MENKVSPLQFKVHPDFRLLTIAIQDSRVKVGMEDSQHKIALWKITKTISNLVASNPKILNSLVEVKINGN